MKYTLSDGTLYLHRHQNGDFAPVKSIGAATCWDEKTKAVNVLQNCINRNLRSRYHVVELPDPRPVLPSEKQEIASNWEESIRQITDFITNIETRKGELSAEISDVDLEISDIYHYIEFHKLNACDGYKCCKMLQQRLQRRRKFKDEQSILMQIDESGVDIEMLKNIQQQYEKLKDRKYTPRKLAKLFEEGPA